MLYWVGCRVLDDGRFELPTKATSTLPAGLASLELRRQVTTNFKIPSHAAGTVIGAARALSAVEIVDDGDDDDDSGDDDDSASN